MAIPTGFPECNVVLNAPPGQEDTCGNLPILRAPGFFTGSVWELDANELEAVKRHGKIFVGVCAGGVTQPPIFVGAYSPGVPQAVLDSFNKPQEG